MKNKTLYTAIGRLTRPMPATPSPIPSIHIGNQEYYLDHQELVLWSVLAWRILRTKEISVLYSKQAANCGLQAQRSLDSCLARLITRGLVVCASGETEYDALYALLSSMYVVPIDAALPIRILSGLRLLFSKRVPLSALRIIYQKDIRNPAEKNVMSLVHRNQLSTAEIISCFDKNTFRFSSSSALLDVLYEDPKVTSDTMPDMVKGSPAAEPVLVAVANLYLRQQILFDRV